MAVQTPLQRAPEFAHEHTPPWHAVPSPQSVEQPPQFALSVSTSTQVLPQRCWPVGHVVHTPLTQASPAEHVFPQPPQLEASEVMSTHPLGDEGQ
jgi:hypothetical protein